MPEPHYPTRLADGVVRLRPWAVGDLTCVERAAADRRITEATTVPADYTREAGLAFVARQHERLASGQGIALAIADHATDQALGYIGLMARPQPGVAGIGYWLVPDARGRGHARRAIGLLTAWALDTFARVEAWVEPDNTASQRALAANGFEREGLLRSFLVLGTRRAEIVVFSRLRGGSEVP
jgi:RimJ/RimL family protein N-acetyltransferase